MCENPPWLIKAPPNKVCDPDRVCDDRGDGLFWSDSLRSVKADAAGRKPDWCFITYCLLSTIVSSWEMAIDLHTVCVCVP